MNNAISLHHQLAFVANNAPPTTSRWGCCSNNAPWLSAWAVEGPQKKRARIFFALSQEEQHHPTTDKDAKDEASSSSKTATAGSRFGKQDYWDSIYEKEATYSWYSGWDDLAPFLQELMSPGDKILIPGVGNDEMLKDMYDDGYKHLTAFDYAPEGIERCKEMLGTERMMIIRQQQQQDDDATSSASPTPTTGGVTLFVGDARNLHNLEDETFDVVLEKGTLDAIIQSGDDGITKQQQKAIGLQNMEQSISEFTRVIKPGGKFISISAICTEALEQSPTLNVGGGDSGGVESWELIRDGSMYITDDGFASNNFDGTLLAWTKKKQ